MVTLWSLPPEVLDSVLIHLDPLDVSLFAQTCRQSQTHVYGFNCIHLWKALYFSQFDNFTTKSPVMGKSGEVEGEEEEKEKIKVDWKISVQTKIKVRQILLAHTRDQFHQRLTHRYPNDGYVEIYNVLEELLNTSVGDSTTSLNLQLLSKLLEREHVQETLLHCTKYSNLNERKFSQRQFRSRDVVEAASKFHTKFGPTLSDLQTSGSSSSDIKYRILARQSAYWVANFKHLQLFGPFKHDKCGEVEWPCMEALSLVISLNVRQATTTTHQSSEVNTDVTRGGVELPIPILRGLKSARPLTQPQTKGFVTSQGDWAGVSGRWRRVVCFLDYRDLHSYNFSSSEVTHDTLESFGEAMRVMTLELYVTHVGLPKEDKDRSHDVVPLGLWNGDPNRPPIFFSGTSKSAAFSNPVSKVRGCVSKTKDGEVRWTLISTYAGEDRWASEGIQVGGEQSAWGVVGVWSDVDRQDLLAPSGPFYFFKMTS